MVSNEELYKALKVIHDVCSEGDGCRSCRLHDPKDHRQCAVSNEDTVPNMWELVSPSDYEAFKKI